MASSRFSHRLAMTLGCLACVTASAYAREGQSGREPTAAAEPAPRRGVLLVGREGATVLDRPGGTPIGRIRAGVPLPYDRNRGRFARVTTPCENRGWISFDGAKLTPRSRVAIDPGHGGRHLGVVGPTGLTEKEVNLKVSALAVEELARRGIGALLTRTQDYEATLAFRAIVARDAGVEALVSVHHNSAPDELRDTPGTETYYQQRGPRSKRLAGLVFEEVRRVFDVPGTSFGANVDAGAKWRLSRRTGKDFYGILRRSFAFGVPAVLSEAAFLSNPEEEALLFRPDVRRREAMAIARAVERYFDGDRPGRVFTIPVRRPSLAVRREGSAGCIDPG